MNLAWIAAVIRPYDIAPHPNFYNDEYSAEPAGQLAAIVIGREWLHSLEAKRNPEDKVSDRALISARKSLDFSTLSEGLAELVQEILSTPSDVARACALTLFACNAAAEMDDYDTCEEVLQVTLEKTDNSDAGKLVRAVLLQQRALRWRDAGRSFKEAAREAVRLLEGIDLQKCQKFSISPGARGSYLDTLGHMITTLRRAAWSLGSRDDFEDEEEPSIIPPWYEQVRAEPSDYMLRIDSSRASVYSKYISRAFEQKFRKNRGWTVGASQTDLFREQLAFELLGHARVNTLRKDVALLRLVQPSSSEDRNPATLSDALRLLRHAGARKELEQVLEHFRSAGPLPALSADARKVLMQRNKRNLMRVPELLVLRAAAELMAPSEASEALKSVLEVVVAGGPIDIPGTWQNPAERLGVALRAAAVLADAAQQPERVARLLLEHARIRQGNDFVMDNAIVQALRHLDLKRMPEDVRSAWRHWLVEGNHSLPKVAEYISIALGVENEEVESTTPLDSLAIQLNVAMASGNMSQVDAEHATAVVEEELSSIRGSASRGIHMSGGRSAADVAAVLIAEAGVTSLWGSLSKLLLDENVARGDRSLAFDRLAIALPEMPVEIRDKFRVEATSLLNVRPEAVFGAWDNQVPYPSALRFLACYEIIGENQTFSLLAKLAGAADIQTRREATRTVAAISKVRTDPWLLALAFQLSHDSEITIAAYAAQALASFSRNQGELADLVSDRLIELLNEDGLLIPLFVMRALAEGATPPAAVVNEISRLSRDHPSFRIRRHAVELSDRL